MKLLDLTLPTPAENLACDEALLDLCEEGGDETLRFWESSEPFVVVGYGNRVETEVNVGECTRREIPILRRCSGGGTVVQGPGCLNYNLTLRIDEGGPLATVTDTNQFVMERNRAALEKLLSVPVSVQGHTDLAFLGRAPIRDGSLPSASASAITNLGKSATSNAPGHWFKFSGNAQRRRRCALVFHGTILYHLDLSLIEALLRFPSAQPAYREHRPHTAFVRNVPESAGMIREALRSAWNAKDCMGEIPHDRIAKLVEEHYSRRDWNFRR